MFRAAPSPLGSKKAGLFLRDRSGAAYDAADPAKKADADAVESILKWLESKLSSADFAKVSPIITSVAGVAEDTGMIDNMADVNTDYDFSDRPDQAADRARRMRRVAQDQANAKGFHGRYPMAARIKHA